MEKKSLIFDASGISINEILKQIGIQTIERDSKKILSYNGVEIPRPPVEWIEKQVKEYFGIEIKYRFETGATSAAVNELILYTDNTIELAEVRDKYFSDAESGARSLAVCIIDLYWDAIACYKKEFPYGAEYSPVKDMTQIERNEYYQIYANRFPEWKMERERNKAFREGI